MREELAFCRLGPIPHSRFLGWHDTDQAKAIAYERWLMGTCLGCNQRPEEWRDDEGRELMDPPFELVETVCPSCAWIEEHRAEAREMKQSKPGVHLVFRRLTDPSPSARSERQQPS